MTLKVITWTCTWVTEHSAYVEVPEDVDLDDYALYDALSQLEADKPERGQTREFQRGDVDWEDVSDDEVAEIRDGQEVETLNLDGYEY